MTTKATDFESLRAQAIHHAQAASGNIWTDYNLHDPGVTLLEQTCFALSEIGYQAAHPIRDLLTGRDGHLEYRACALYDPRDVLPTAPVTDSDLTSHLSDQPGVARAWVSQTGTAGLYSVLVIPSQEDALDEKALTAHVTACFARVRPLATDLARVTVARKRDTVLSCQIGISATADPERVAARFYYHVSAILRGRSDANDSRQGATRAAVYAEPELFFRPRADTGAQLPDINAHLARLRSIPGIRDIGTLALRELPAQGDQDTAVPTYPALVLPQSPDEIELELRVGDTALTLDHTRIHEEYIRVSAENISRAQHHLAETDWAVLTDGRRRDFGRTHVDDMLPAIYRIYGRREPQPRAVQTADRDARAPDGLFVQYRDAINGHLDQMSKALADLPGLFAAQTDARTEDPEDHARRIDVLDLLLALQGETLPVIRHTGLHHYRSATERQQFDLDWRLRYLEALPTLNAARGTGPMPSAAGGFMARLGLLADISVEPRTAQPDPLGALGWTLDPGTGIPAGSFARRDLLLPLNPFDMIVPRDNTTPALAQDVLKRLSPWVTGDRLHPDLFRRAADPDAFLLSPVSGGQYAVLFDSGRQDTLYHVETMPDKSAAMSRVNQLRASWRHLHQAGETASLVEDILLRGTDQRFEAHSCTLVLSGWTARTGRESYRSYVTELVQKLAPAHVVVTPRWLDRARMTTFEDLRARVATREPEARARLRSFLAQQGAAS